MPEWHSQVHITCIHIYYLDISSARHSPDVHNALITMVMRNRLIYFLVLSDGWMQFDDMFDDDGVCEFCHWIGKDQANMVRLPWRYACTNNTCKRIDYVVITDVLNCYVL